jgi:hypothetical protein
MSDRAPLLELAGAAFQAASRVNDGPTLRACVESDLIESAALLDAV